MKEVFQNVLSAIDKVPAAGMEKDDVLISIIHDRDGDFTCRILGMDSDIIACLAMLAIERPKFYRLLQETVLAAEEWKRKHGREKGNLKNNSDVCGD